MTSKDLSIFNSLRPFSIGFDDMFDQFENMLGNGAMTMQSNYPPYNIRKVDEYKYIIELALAGFSENDIEVEVADGTLTVRSIESKDTADSDYVHRGIARRAFSKAWTLSDDMVVKGAEFTNGLLNISLEKIVPEEKKPRIIPISSPSVIEHKKK